MALRLGGALPLHVGAGPRALHAWEPPSLWAEYVRSGDLKPFTEHTPVTRAALFKALTATLESGWSVSDEDVNLGMAAVGAPIFDHRGRVCAAVSMSGPRPAILGDQAEASRRLIMDAGAEISRSLGHVPAPAAVG
jgi:DNA-binding IclR family transcriptional regulator